MIMEIVAENNLVQLRAFKIRKIQSRQKVIYLPKADKFSIEM